MKKILEQSKILYKRWVNFHCGSSFENFPVYVDLSFQECDQFIDKKSCYWIVDTKNESIQLFKHEKESNCIFCKKIIL